MQRSSCIGTCRDVPSRVLGRELRSYARPHAVGKARRPCISHAAMTESVLSPHPDALTRRQEAEARQLKRRESVKAGKAARNWWEIQAPPNVRCVSSLAELQAFMEQARAEEGCVLVDFFASHCVACKTMYPKMRQIADRNPEVIFLKVNAAGDEMRSYCQSIGVNKVPYFHVYKSGSLVSEFSANLGTINRVRGEVQTHKA